MELSDKDKVSAYYTHGFQTDSPLSMERGGKTYHLHRDYLGSVIALSSSSGKIVQQYAYDAFGNITHIDKDGNKVDSPSIDNLFTYASREWDEDMEVFDNRARWYSPELGRFLSADPANADGPNPYWYGRNNPVNFTDPFGLASYLVSRDINAFALRFLFSHNFIVIDRGDGGNPEFYSFGELSDGTLGQVFNDVAITDKNRYESGDVTKQKIDASDEEVRRAVQYFTSLMPRLKYNRLFSNSNTAAQYIADRAQGSSVNTPSSSLYGAAPSSFLSNKANICPAGD